MEGSILNVPAAVWLGAIPLAIAVGILAWVLLVPSRALPEYRRRYGTSPAPTMLARAASSSTGFIGRTLDARGRLESMTHALDLAGVRRSVPEVILLVGAGALVGAAAGVILGGPLNAILLGGMVVLGAVLFIRIRASRRRAEFADQLDDFVQLLGSNLRAGHGVLQGLDSVSRELEEPAASEISRVVNHVRVGRDMGEALSDAAERMDSDDFRWVSQAISIHRQVGGNLAEVMDTIGETIRERNQIRRQVLALSAEGKLSAYILIALPIVLAFIIQFLNPDYMAKFTEGLLGYAMILVAIVMLIVGSVWLSKIVKIKF